MFFSPFSTALKENVKQEADAMYPNGVDVDPYNIESLFKYFYPEYSQGVPVKDLPLKAECMLRYDCLHPTDQIMNSC